MGASQIFLAIFSALMTAVAGSLAASVKMHRERERMADEQFKAEHGLLLDGMKVLMRAELFRLHEEYVQQGKPIPIDVKEQANSAYQVYSGMHCNGVGTHLWQELMEAHVSK